MNVAYSLPSSSNEFITEPTPSIEPIIDPLGIEEDKKVVAPRRSKRQRVDKSFGDDFIVYLIDGTPTTIAEAYASPDADIGRMQSVVRWTPSLQMEHGK